LLTDPREIAPKRFFHLPFPRHNRTAFVQIDTALCLSCGACVAACPQAVLGLIAFFSHRHVHVDRASACKGCRKCVKACPQGAIQPRLDVQRKTSVAGSLRNTGNPSGQGTPLAN
jgi:NAD-dependent dihydropyrimidine dehydrogenase PreA subunit